MKSLTSIAVAGGMACAILAAIPVVAQKSDVSPTTPRAKITQVTDERYGDPDIYGCTVDLTFSGGGAEHALRVGNLRIDEAVDDLGHDLRTDRAKTGQPEDVGGGGGTYDTTFSPLHKSSRPPGLLYISLSNPSKNATTIKELKGRVQLFTPTDVNGGLVTVPDFSSTVEKPVDNPIFKKYQILLFNLPPQDFRKMKGNQRKAMWIALRKAGLKDEDIQDLKENFQDSIKFLDPAEPGKTLVFYHKDPENMIVETEFRDAAGNEVEPDGGGTLDNLSVLYFDTKLPEKINLVLSLAVPGAVKDCSFDFHDISLH